MDDNSTIKSSSWKDKGLDPFMQRQLPDTPKPANFISGAGFDALLDELLFNRMIKLKDLRSAPQGNDQGKLYWDGDNKKFKIWIGEKGKWADVEYTSTSTSSTSSSSTSTTT